MNRALGFLIEAAQARGLASAVFLLPQEPPDGLAWREIAGRPGVRYFGVTPYWLLEGVPTDGVEAYVRHWCRRVVATTEDQGCLLYTSPSPRDRTRSRMP